MNPFANFDPRLLGALVFVFGLMIGSFLNVVIYRVPAEESIAFPGSHCPRCDRPLTAWENMPVLSWLALRGRCYSCKSPISWRYPAIELLTGALFYTVYACFGATTQTSFLLVFVGLLVAIFWIDWDTQYIFDSMTLPGVAIGLLYSYLVTHQLAAAVAAALYAAAAISLIYGLSWLILREDGIGGGDLTLLAMLGAWLGIWGMGLSLVVGVFVGAAMGMAQMFTRYVRQGYWPPVVIAVIGSLVCYAFAAYSYGLSTPELRLGVPACAALMGSAMGFIYAQQTRDKHAEKPRIPFGPALVLGGLCALFFQPQLTTWYWQHLGPALLGGAS